MINFIYDGTFEGLVSAIAERFMRKVKCVSYGVVDASFLFSNSEQIATDLGLVERICRGVIKKSSKSVLLAAYKIFLSELPAKEKIIDLYLEEILYSPINIEKDFTKPIILQVRSICKKMDREVHRMHAFVRFKKDENDIYTAEVEPDFNILPLIGEHFEKRYADQLWFIFDRKRNYGIFYDLREIRFIELFNLSSQSNIPVEENDFSLLWKSYYKSANIPERNNLKLHLRHVPRRYWKYLIEKD